MGSLNLGISLFILVSYRGYIRMFSMWRLVSGLACVFMVLGMLFSENVASGIEQGLYRDKVILREQTPYQKLVVTKHKDDIRLFINGNIQFSSKDEYRYHEALVHIPMSAAKSRRNVLVLGGGDGLAVREILKYPEVEKIVLVDLDARVVDLCRTNQDIAALNQGSLDSPKLEIRSEDAYGYLENNYRNEGGEGYDGEFDVIITDLPDPNSESLNKLYTDLFYRLCSNNLTEHGVMSVQSTSPYYAADAYWCINKTVGQEFPYVYPYHVQVPSFGDWGFQLASKDKVSVDGLELQTEGKFLNQSGLGDCFYLRRMRSHAGQADGQHAVGAQAAALLPGSGEGLGVEALTDGSACQCTNQLRRRKSQPDTGHSPKAGHEKRYGNDEHQAP